MVGEREGGRERERRKREIWMRSGLRMRSGHLEARSAVARSFDSLAPKDRRLLPQPRPEMVRCPPRTDEARV